MIDGKEINADFQFLGNRVSSFSLETKIVDTKGKRVSPVFEYDYSITECGKTNDKYFGVVQLKINGRA
ncbi:MAG: preprotein translocase subunit SecB, partial [Clostridium sp.]|nr:preprotein translocase subunit SecB [Clostridium sp.]